MIPDPADLIMRGEGLPDHDRGVIVVDRTTILHQKYLRMYYGFLNSS